MIVKTHDISPVVPCPPAPQCHPIPPTPVVPIVSVSSVNGMIGNVILRNLVIGNKEYNGSEQVVIGKEAFELETAVRFKGVRSKRYIEKITVADVGDLYLCTEEELFYLYAGDDLWLNFRAGTEGSGGIQSISLNNERLPVDTAGNVNIDITPLQNSLEEEISARQSDIADVTAALAEEAEIRESSIQEVRQEIQEIQDPVLPEDIVTDITVGHLVAGTLLPAGTLIADVLKEILVDTTPIERCYYYGVSDVEPTDVTNLTRVVTTKDELLAGVTKYFTTNEQYVTFAVDKSLGVVLDKVIVNDFPYPIGIITIETEDQIIYCEESPTMFEDPASYNFSFKEG